MVEIKQSWAQSLLLEHPELDDGGLSLAREANVTLISATEWSDPDERGMLTRTLTVAV